MSRIGMIRSESKSKTFSQRGALGPSLSSSLHLLDGDSYLTGKSVPPCTTNGVLDSSLQSLVLDVAYQGND